MEAEVLAHKTTEVEKEDAQNEVILLEETIKLITNQKDHLITEKNNL